MSFDVDRAEFEEAVASGEVDFLWTAYQTAINQRNSNGVIAREKNSECERLREGLRQIWEGDYPSEAGDAETWAKELLGDLDAVDWKADEADA